MIAWRCPMEKMVLSMHGTTVIFYRILQLLNLICDSIVIPIHNIFIVCMDQRVLLVTNQE